MRVLGVYYKKNLDFIGIVNIFGILIRIEFLILRILNMLLIKKFLVDSEDNKFSLFFWMFKIDVKCWLELKR